MGQPQSRWLVMNSSVWKKVISVVAGVAASVVVAGCASSQAPRSTAKYLGYSELVTQGQVRLYAGSSLEERNGVAAAALLQANRQSTYTLTTTVILSGGQQALIRRHLPAGGFDENFGRVTEMEFSIQPCNQFGSENGLVVCTDRAAPRPVVISKRVLLKGGQKVTVQFPGNLTWTYQVLEQASPLI